MIEMEVRPGRAHRLVFAEPPFGIHRLVQLSKGRSSRLLRQECPWLRVGCPRSGRPATSSRPWAVRHLPSSSSTSKTGSGYEARRLHLEPSPQLDPLAQAAEELYSRTVVSFSRTVRKQGVWLTPSALMRWHTSDRLHATAPTPWCRCLRHPEVLA